MSSNRWTIMKKLIALLLIAAAVSISFLIIAVTVSTRLIFTSDGFDRPDEKILVDLKEYIQKEEIRTDDEERLDAWCGANRGVDIEVFVNERLVYSSTADLRGLETPIRETELDRRRAVKVSFSDALADVILYDYFYSYENTVVAAILAAIAIFFIIVIVGIRRETEYIRLLNDEIHALEGGDLTREMTIRGSDEIATLAESIDEFRKSMKNQLTTIERLEKTNRMTSAEIAHDLRTPLTSLMMYLDFGLSEVQGKEPKAEEYLTKAKEKSIRLKNLLEENFSYTTMTDYFLKEKQEVSADIVLSGFINDFVVNLESRGFHVLTDIFFKESSILLQRDALGRIFGNLATNIYKYAKKEGNVYICGRDKGTCAEIRIENEIRVYEGGKPHSTGFGSRIVKRLMEEMGGEYSTEERDGRYVTILRFMKADNHISNSLGKEPGKVL